MAFSKIILNGTTQIDVTQLTATAATTLDGYTGMAADGTVFTGEYEPSSASLQTKTNISPTTSSQTITPDTGYDGLSSVQINAISPVRTSSDMTVSGATVTAPAGYYASPGSQSVSLMTLPTSASTGTSGTLKATISRSTSNQYINIPRGYNSSAAYYQVSAVANGTEGTPTATKGTVSNHAISVTPSVTNSAGYITGNTKTGTAVTVTAAELVSGTKSISANGTGIDVTNYANVDVAVPAPTPSLQSKTGITPTESSQTIEADTGYDGLSSVQIDAISSTYVGSGITQRSSSDLTASGATVSVPSGYYASNASKAVASGSATAPASISGTSATVSTSGSNTLTLSKTVSVTPSVSAGYVSSGTAGNSSVSLSASVNIRSSSDMTASGATVTAPAGYYASAGTKSVDTMTLPTALSSTSSGTSKLTVSRQTSTKYINIPAGYNATAGYYTISAVADGTAGTPTASKGAVSNHAISVTPSVTNTTGYITGGTKTGTAVSVSASELVSGNLALTDNTASTDCTNYATVSVAISYSTIYTSSSAPSSSQGSNGDVWVRTS